MRPSGVILAKESILFYAVNGCETILIGDSVLLQVNLFNPLTQEIEPIALDDDSVKTLISYGIDHLSQSGKEPIARRLKEALVDCAIEEFQNKTNLGGSASGD